MLLVALALAAGACDDESLGPSLRGRPIFGVDTENNLLVFGSESPETVSSLREITGLASGEAILGIDVRPVDDRIYALGATSRVYIVDTLGVATQVGTAPFSPALVGTSFGWDVNPVPVLDDIRVHSDSDQDLRLNPLDGAVAGVDPTLAFAVNDTHAAVDPNVVGSAYQNSVPGAHVATVLYAIDSGLDALVRLVVPITGTLVTVGPLGVDTASEVGFDIAVDDGAAYAALSASGGSSLYAINLRTGAATLVGEIGSENPLVGISIAP